MAFKVEDWIKNIKELKVSDLKKLIEAIEEEFGVSAAATMVASSGEDQEEESLEKDVELVTDGGSKIGAIKLVRELTGKGLMEAKQAVDSLPLLLAEGVSKEKAEEIAAKFKEIGAQVNIK